MNHSGYKNIGNERVNFVINTMSSKKNTSADGFLIRRVSAENNISCVTLLGTKAGILGHSMTEMKA